MKQIFNYQKFNDETLDGMVETFSVLVDKYLDGKSDTKEYKEANAELTKAFMKYCVERIPDVKFNSLEDVRNPMIHNSIFFTQAFDTVMAAVYTPAIPTVLARNYQNFWEVVQVGWGENAKYSVKSNEMFIVNDLAEGVARGGLQTSYDTEYSVAAHPRQIATYVDWYHVATGKQDWGYIVSKTALSYANWIQTAAIKAMASVITSAGDWGMGGYIANGFSDQNWVITSDNVKMANGGAQVYGFGSKMALMDILPSQTPAANGFRYGENSEIIKTGYLPEYKGVPLVEMDQALMPNTVNGTPVRAVPEKIIYLLPMAFHKPIKVVIEGTTLTVSKNPYESKDHCYSYVVTAHLGVDAVVGTKFGAITLE